VSCGPLPGEAAAPLRSLGRDRAVIEGVVVREGELLPGAYVRLLDASGDFVAEVQTDWAGRFRFYCTAGTWTLRTLAPAVAPTEERLSVEPGQVAPVEVLLSE